MSNDPKKEPEKGAPDKKAAKTLPLGERIGFRKLDLTMEEVEERISPRETNVFDK